MADGERQVLCMVSSMLRSRRSCSVNFVNDYTLDKIMSLILIMFFNYFHIVTKKKNNVTIQSLKFFNSSNLINSRETDILRILRNYYNICMIDLKFYKEGRDGILRVASTMSVNVETRVTVYVYRV